MVTACSRRYGGETGVPAEVRGRRDCAYLIPRGEVEVELTATALSAQGGLLPEHNGPVSFRTVPGDLTGDYAFRWAHSRAGVANGVVKVAHLFGEVRAWAEDAPPQPVLAGGQLWGNLGERMQSEANATEIYRDAERLQISYFFEPRLIFQLSVSLKGLSLYNGVKLPLGGQAAVGVPRAVVSGNQLFPPIAKGELLFATGGSPTELTSGSFSLTFAEDGSPLAGRTALGSFSGRIGTREHRPVEPPSRTLATGLSTVIHFEEPTLAKVQIPDGFDNRSSPLVGQFLTVGKDPEGGGELLQSCAADAARDGKKVQMVVTGTDPGGFFVTDLSACRQVEQITDPATGGTVVRVPEPKEECLAGGRCAISGKSCAGSEDCLGYLPGTYGSMFIYNYSFPEGLDVGDLLLTLSGSVQEFTSTTQLTFPAWTAERVRALPMDQWDKWLKQVKPVELNLRHCGLDNTITPFLTDTMCGHNRRNLKLESLESALVVARRLRFPQRFASCDRDGDSSVPFFCESKLLSTGCQDQAGKPLACAAPNGFCNPTTNTCQAAEWDWRDCSFGENPPGEVETEETVCHRDCATGRGPHQGVLCSERATFVTYGQFVAEMAGPGPAEAGLDDSLPARMQRVAIGSTSNRIASGYAPGTEVRVFCTAGVRLKAGDAKLVATAQDLALPPKTLYQYTFGATETHLAVIADGDFGPASVCSVAENTHTRINVVTKDAVPELQPDCREDDPNPERAEQCRRLRGATFEVTGHLRHLQPGRPRWVILPRDADDLCCRPAPGQSCPKPIKPCL